ncbi:MAG: formylglycine-generating enzyme family protein [Marinilabiliaceae bacterium]|nr:formylglycine-generating enzyme family protein [Marinilabiliaceae bacterium]
MSKIIILLITLFFGATVIQTDEVESTPKSHPGEPEMVHVYGATFTMGCTNEHVSNCDSDEKPTHQVTVSSFDISKYPITQGQWKAVMGTTIQDQRDKVNPKNPLKGEGDNFPMYYVSYDDAQEFIVRLNELTGKNYRLPTEAEWEFAARGGVKTNAHKYSGDNFLNNVAWSKDKSGGTTHPVGTKKPNQLEIFDLSGNVWEWCSDWYGNYSTAAKLDPQGATSGFRRVARGGSWNSPATDCRTSKRGFGNPDQRNDTFGFRIVL